MRGLRSRWSWIVSLSALSLALLWGALAYAQSSPPAEQPPVESLIDILCSLDPDGCTGTSGGTAGKSPGEEALVVPPPWRPLQPVPPPARQSAFEGSFVLLWTSGGESSSWVVHLEGAEDLKVRGGRRAGAPPPDAVVRALHTELGAGAGAGRAQLRLSGARVDLPAPRAGQVEETWTLRLEPVRNDGPGGPPYEPLQLRVLPGGARAAYEAKWTHAAELLCPGGPSTPASCRSDVGVALRLQEGFVSEAHHFKCVEIAAGRLPGTLPAQCAWHTAP